MMSDNTTTKDGGGVQIPVATDNVTYSGDADQNLALMHPVMVTGSEGSKVTNEVFMAEDAAHTSGDFGMMALGVRKDTATALAGADGDYQPAIFDSSGRMHVNVGNTVTVASHAVTNAGTFAVQATEADGANVVLGSKADAKSTATDTTSITMMQVMKQISASVQAPPSQAVTNAGTFAVQDSAAEASLSVMDDWDDGSDRARTVGAAAHGASVAGNPNLMGLEARKTLGTAVSDGQVVRSMGDQYGMTVVVAWPTSHAASNGTPITATTTSVIAAPSAGNHLRILRMHMSNGGSTATWVAIRDGAAGTQHYRTYLPQGGAVSLNLNMSGPLDLTTATRLDIVLSAAGSVEYEIDYLSVTD